MRSFEPRQSFPSTASREPSGTAPDGLSTRACPETAGVPGAPGAAALAMGTPGTSSPAASAAAMSKHTLRTGAFAGFAAGGGALREVSQVLSSA